jgi:UDP-N-acetylmuramoylalanine--D-glutamate ligase
MQTAPAGKSVTVMGLGRFGGGAGVSRWLALQGADVLLTDKLPAEQLSEPLESINDLVSRGIVKLRLGEHNVSDFTTVDLVIANPAVPKPWEDRFLRAAHAAEIPITTEIRLLVERINRDRVIGVTGSAGKSTTTAMIHHLLVKSGVRAHLGGNIGGSLLNDLDRINPDDWIVLELSSAMLHWLGPGTGHPDQEAWSPRIAVLTNISPNHLVWLGSFEHYRDSKHNIFSSQHPGDHQLRGEDVEHDARPIPLKIPGRHNQLNARLAVETVHRTTGARPQELVAMLRDFAGLPHRLQLAFENGTNRFYNDSKSTTPEATLLAIEAFEDQRAIHLIAGGYDKGSDLTPIARLAAALAGLYVVGKTGPAIAAAAPRGGFVEDCETLEKAVNRAIGRLKPHDVLLLSPGCASWDQFINFEQRGEQFVKLVKQHFAQPIRA